MTQAEALDMLKLGHNVYLTGSAGSGKTYVLNKYIEYLKTNDAPVAVTASTGIAASHMNGQTIHSWSGLGIRSALLDTDLELMEEKRYLWERFQETKVLIIDEISMLHHYRLDLVDRITRFFKRDDRPFGGIQVVLSGDFFQLPPVSRKGEPEALFSYWSESWKALDLKVCYLTESHRHEDQDFISVLNAIRSNTVSEKTLEALRRRYNKNPASSIRPTKLYTHNLDVDAINTVELDKVEGEIFSYAMSERGRPPLVAALKASCLAPEVLKLKKGAQVMFVKNNYDAGYVNGTLGTVVDCTPEYPIIKTIRGDIINAEPADWSVEEDGKVKANISQVPLRLAWAITVHKSQGMTLDAAEIDLSKSFEKGMGYVALSRVRSLSGLKLMGLNEGALAINEDVLLFDEDLQAQSAKNAPALAKLDRIEKEKMQGNFLDHIRPKNPKKKEKKIDTHIQTKVLILEKLPLEDIAIRRNLKKETVIHHIEILLEEKHDIDIAYIKASLSPDRLKQVIEGLKKSFAKNGDYRLAPVRTILGPGFSYEEIRLARLFLEK